MNRPESCGCECIYQCYQNMKKYAVLKQIGNFDPKVEREFDNIDDARMFKNILMASETNGWKYYLVEVLE